MEETLTSVRHEGVQVRFTEPMIDIHCHLLPGIDDGATSWAESLEMARMAVADQITTIVATPHQLGSFSNVTGKQVRRAVGDLQLYLRQHNVPLTVRPGADVRVQVDLVNQLASGNVLTLGDRGKHILLELPHELYFSLDACLDDLARLSITGILSHPERNQGLLRKPRLIGALVGRACLMQVTAGSLVGTFGPRCQALAELIVRSDWAHFVATDAHGSKTRRPLLRRAFQHVTEIASEQIAYELCCRNPARVVRGLDVPVNVQAKTKRKRTWFKPFRKLTTPRHARSA